MKTKKMVLVALFAALTIVCAQLIIPLPFIPVPFSLSVVAIFTCGAVLDKKSAVLAQIIYILLGICGLPVFSGFSGGIQKIVGPTGGYIMAYPLMVFITSYLLEKLNRNNFLHLAVAMGAGLGICYLLGSIWLAFVQQINLWQAVVMGVIPFVLLDIVKIGISASFALAFNKSKEKIFLK